MPVSQFPAISGNTPQALGYAEITTTVTSISGTFTDVSGLSVTVNVLAGRRIKISAHALLQQRTSAGQIVFAIWEDGIRINEDAFNATTDSYITGNASCVRTPATGTHTYKITAGTTANTVDLITGTNFPAFILVEDITGVAIPAPPVSTPVGTLAYAQNVANDTTVLPAGTDIPGCSVNVAVPAGRTLKITAHGTGYNSQASSNQLLTLQIREGTTVLGEVNQWTNATGAYGDGQTGDATAIVTPSAGTHTYKLTGYANNTSGLILGRPANPVWILVEDITPTPALASGAPSSTLAYAESVATQTAVGTEVDITGCFVTVTVPAGRRIRISGRSETGVASAADTSYFLLIKEGSTIVGRGADMHSITGRESTAQATTILSPSAGTHTYKLTGQALSGTVNFGQNAADNPSYILVEDITGVSYNYTSPGLLPVNSSSPPSSPSVGSMIYEYDTGKSKIYSGSGWGELTTGSTITLGYAEASSAQTGISTEASITALTVTVTVPAGRRLKVSSQLQLSSATTAGTSLLRIKESSTTLQLSQSNYNTIGGNGWTLRAEAIISPSTGTHTYYCTVQGTAGTVDMNATSGPVPYLLVEDITGTTVPVSSASVPVGILAQGQLTANSTAGVSGTVPLTLNVTVISGRTLKVHFETYFTNAGGTALVARLHAYMDGTQIGQADIKILDTTSSERVSGEVLLSPTAGAHTFTFDWDRVGSTNAQLVAGATFPSTFFIEDISPTPASSTGAPGSTLAYSETATNPYPSGFTAESEIVRATFTVPAGRRVRVTAKCEVQVANTDQWVAGDIRISTVGGTGIGEGTLSSMAANQQNTLHIETVLTPAAGTYTYLFTIRKVSGTGNVTLAIGANVPAFILVEDITGSVWPAGSSVTAGMVASEAWTTFTPIVTQGAAPTQTVNKGAYTKIGRTVTVQGSVGFTGAGTAAQPIVITNLPVPASSNTLIMGVFRYFDAGNTNFAGAVVHASTTTCSLFYQGDGNAMGVGTPTIANGDLLQFSVTYEAAT